MEKSVINRSVVRGIAVPNYSNALEEQSAMIFITNKYTVAYFSIIEKARSRVLSKSECKETHHIVPRSLGGSDKAENLVDLTYKEHRVCHKLLVKMTRGVDKSKMAYALLFFKVDTVTKKRLRKNLSDYRKNFIPITNGLVDKWLEKDVEIPEGFYYGFSPATIKKHGDGNKGKKWITNGNVSYQIKDSVLPEGFYYGQTKEHKAKNSEALSGNKNPMYGKTGRNHPAYGYRHSMNALSLMSDTKLGSRNPMYGKLPKNAKSIEIDGVNYRSMTEARLKTGMSRKTIENLVKGKTK